ncbi:MAG: periplasmic heavy metal sensor [Pseudooceanicola sp.]
MTDDHTPPPSPPRPGMRPWLRVLVFASLALNLLVIGALAGLVAVHDRDDPRRPPRLDRSVGPLTHALSDEDKRRIGREMRRAYREGRPSRAEFYAEYQQVIAALRADPYDPSIVADSLRRQLDASAERQRIGQDLLLERLAAMTPEERAEFAARLEEGLARVRDRRK